MEHDEVVVLFSPHLSLSLAWRGSIHYSHPHPVWSPQGSFRIMSHSKWDRQNCLRAGIFYSSRHSLGGRGSPMFNTPLLFLPTVLSSGMW